MNPFDLILIQPILNLLILLYRILETLSIPWALGFAIILLTAIIRFALWPLTSAQLKSTQKLAALKPHLEKIKEAHGHDKAKHQQEVSKLYKEHGVNPLAGCLPLLVQIPIFMALYQVLLKAVNTNGNDFLSYINGNLYFDVLKIDKTPDSVFLGINLAAKPSEWSTGGLYLLLIPVLTGLFQFVQSKMMQPEKSKNALKKKDENKKPSLEDSMQDMQSQMVYIMPAMIAFFSYSFPYGLALYWNTFTIIGIIQQYKIAGAGALNKYLPENWRK